MLPLRVVVVRQLLRDRPGRNDGRFASGVACGFWSFCSPQVPDGDGGSDFSWGSMNSADPGRQALRNKISKPAEQPASGSQGRASAPAAVDIRLKAASSASTEEDPGWGRSGGWWRSSSTWEDAAASSSGAAAEEPTPPWRQPRPVAAVPRPKRSSSSTGWSWTSSSQWSACAQLDQSFATQALPSEIPRVSFGRWPRKSLQLDWFSAASAEWLGDASRSVPSPPGPRIVLQKTGFDGFLLFWQPAGGDVRDRSTSLGSKPLPARAH